MGSPEPSFLWPFLGRRLAPSASPDLIRVLSVDRGLRLLFLHGLCPRCSCFHGLLHCVN